jgi:lantibiotic biosynthesis protein
MQSKPATANPWRPLVSGETAAHIRQVVAAVGDSLMDAGQYAGPFRFDSVEAATFHLALAAAGMGAHHQEAGRRFVEGALEQVAASEAGPSLFGGLAGVAWLLRYQARLEGSTDVDLSLDEVDGLLLQFVSSRSCRSVGFDLIEGLTGLGLYALAALPGPRAADTLAHVVRHLDEMAEVLPDGGRRWATAGRRAAPEGPSGTPAPRAYDLGAAHGVAGVISLLGQIAARGIERERALAVMGGALHWLRQQRLPVGSAGRYGYTAGDGGDDEPQVPARAAWCYGDPGIALALLVAADALGDQAMRAEALDLACGAALRPPSGNGVDDASLCHGASGLAHLFNRAYQASGDARLREAAVYWLHRALDMRDPKAPLGGYRSWFAADGVNKTWVEDPSLLTGAMGVALVLMAAADPRPPGWDHLILVAAAPAGAQA